MGATRQALTTVPGITGAKVLCEHPAHNREVVTLFWGGTQPVVAKVMSCERIPIDTGDSIGRVIDYLRTYWRRLRGMGTPVPDSLTLMTVCTDGGAQPDVIIELMPHLGEPVDTLLAVAEQEAARVMVEAILTTLTPFLERSDNIMGPVAQDPIGLDLIPRNFVVGPDGIWYVDISPPKIFTDEKYVLEIPNPTNPDAIKIGIFRHFEQTGALLVFLVQLGKLRPDLLPMFITLIERYLESLGKDDILAFLRERPAFQYRRGTIDRAALHAQIVEMGFLQIYDLRAVACVLAHQGHMTTEALHRFFDLSHFQDEPLPEERMRELRAVLLAALDPSPARQS